MTSEIPLSVGGTRFIAKVGGYTGKTESEDPIADITDGYMVWFSEAQSDQLPRIGSRVTVRIGGKSFKGKVIGGPGKGRYGAYGTRLKKIVLSQRVGTKLSRNKIRALHEKATRIVGV